METFGACLRYQCNQHKLTREEFAIHEGCSVLTLRKIDTSERCPSVQIADQIGNLNGIAGNIVPCSYTIEIALERFAPVK